MSTPTVASLRARLPRPRSAASALVPAPVSGTPDRPIPLRLLVVLAMLSAIGPLAVDMYLPAFPSMAAQLSTSATAIQLTLTTFMIGMALGQLVLGPMSDRFGRRRLLILGATVCCAAGLVCALTPSIGVMIAARFVQGFAGAAGMVIGRAVVADLAQGRVAAKAFSTLAVIMGVAPVSAPLLGGVLLEPIGWRGIFGVITLAAAAMAVAVLLVVPETLPHRRRQTGGIGAVATSAKAVLSNRRYLGYVLTGTSAFAALFAYVAASPFVFKNVLGLSTGWFSVAFAANAIGIVAGASASALLLRRIGPRQIVTGGVLLQLACVLGLVVAVLFLGAPTVVVLPLLWLNMFSCGAMMGNATALAIDQVRFAAGTGSAVQGALQFFLGALVSPLVGLAGEDSAVPMVIVMLVGSAVAVFSLFVISRPFARAVSAPPSA